MSDAVKIMCDHIRQALKLDHVSFAELSRIPGFNGDLAWCLPGYDNIVVWNGMSQVAGDALRQMQKVGEFHFHAASSLLVYVLDGVVLNLPIAKATQQYKKPHWLPVVLKRGPAPCPEAECPIKKQRARDHGAPSPSF
jgi:hypothetical protein